MAELLSFDVDNSSDLADAALLWTEACRSAMALSAKAMQAMTRPCIDGAQAGQFARVNGQRMGFVLVSLLRHSDSGVMQGWVDALVIAPEFQRRGIGRALLEWGEAWLREHACGRVRIGSSLRPFVPGAPIELGSTDFFRAQGYRANSDGAQVWDMGHDLSLYETPLFVREMDVVLRPATDADVPALRAFYVAEFPGRWLYDFELHLYDGARVGDYFLLESERGLEACCLMTFEDSSRPVERYYPTPLPRPWGQAGTIGVRADRRAVGYGSALLDAALLRLRAGGVRGCMIDWTDIGTYYERFGFRKHRAYDMLAKELV